MDNIVSFSDEFSKRRANSFLFDGKVHTMNASLNTRDGTYKLRVSTGDRGDTSIYEVQGINKSIDGISYDLAESVTRDLSD